MTDDIPAMSGDKRSDGRRAGGTIGDCDGLAPGVITELDITLQPFLTS